MRHRRAGRALTRIVPADDDKRVVAEAKDWLGSRNDYRINLKAELEIRMLHEKLDHLLLKQWERLAEIQQIQLDTMQEIVERQGSRS